MNTTSPDNKKRVVYIIIITAICILSATLYWYTTRNKAIDVSAQEVFRKEVVHYVTATGRIEPEVEVNISPDVSGEIIELPVKEGDPVRKGGLLFKIQPDVYENQVEQNKARLNLSRSQSLEAQARKLKAEDDFRKARMLYDEQLISQSDYLTAKTNAEAAAAIYEASLYTISQNRSLLDQAMEQLNKTVIKSPIDGVVISLDSKLGERVVGTGQFPGTDVLRIANLDSMQVEVEVNENDIVNVKLDDRVVISVDAFGERTFDGVVREISNSAITQAAGTQEEVTNFAVDIRILNHERMLKPGMSATADIETERVKDALVVPIQSVTLRTPDTASGRESIGNRGETGPGNPAGPSTDSGREGVFVIENDKAQFRTVTTGTTDNTHIVIENGVDEGDIVVSGSYTAITRLLQDGSRVNVTQQ